MTMSIIKPNTLTDAMLTSSSAAETAPAAYAGGTTYALNATAVTGTAGGILTVWKSLQAGNIGHTPASSPTWWIEIGSTYAVWDSVTAWALGAIVISATTHRAYQSVQAANTNHAVTDVAWWTDIAPTNRWAMFDSSVGTLTSVYGELTVVMRPGAVGGIALMELAGQQVTVTMKDAPSGTVIYSNTTVLDGTIITSFYEWFYEEYTQLTDLVLTGLPTHFVSNELTISIIGATGLATVSCGICHFGQVVNIGNIQYGAVVGIVDYSKKTVDAFGNYSITQRAFSKRADIKLMTLASDFNRIFRALTAIRSTPCIFIGSEAPGYQPLLVYGFYKDFSIDVAYSRMHLCNLSIEGLI